MPLWIHSRDAHPLNGRSVPFVDRTDAATGHLDDQALSWRHHGKPDWFQLAPRCQRQPSGCGWLTTVTGTWLQNVDFRRALSLGIDRAQINDAFMLGPGVVGTPIPAAIIPESPGEEWRLIK